MSKLPEYMPLEYSPNVMASRFCREDLMPTIFTFTGIVARFNSDHRDRWVNNVVGYTEKTGIVPPLETTSILRWFKSEDRMLAEERFAKARLRFRGGSETTSE